MFGFCSTYWPKAHKLPIHSHVPATCMFMGNKAQGLPCTLKLMLHFPSVVDSCVSCD
jgi:hypothetical protein